MKLVRISAIWCPACLIMRPIYEKIINEFNLETIEYDYDFDDEVANLNVGNVLPVAILYDGENELIRIIGEKKEDYIKNAIKEFV